VWFWPSLLVLGADLLLLGSVSAVAVREVRGARRGRRLLNRP
jgi:hypothetical protein